MFNSEDDWEFWDRLDFEQSDRERFCVELPVDNIPLPSSLSSLGLKSTANVLNAEAGVVYTEGFKPLFSFSRRR